MYWGLNALGVLNNFDLLNLLLLSHPSPFFSEDTFRQSPFTSNSKDLLPSESVMHGRISAPGTDILLTLLLPLVA
jgi:hypothetical protein